MESLWKMRMTGVGGGEGFISISLTLTTIHYREEPKFRYPTEVGVGEKKKTKEQWCLWSVLVVTGQVSMANLEHSSRGKKRAAWQDKGLMVPAASEQQPRHVGTAYLIPDQEAQGIYKGANRDLLCKAFDHRSGCARLQHRSEQKKVCPIDTPSH